MVHTLNVVLSRSVDGRSWIATVAGNGRAVGIGPTPAIAVDELFRWSPGLYPAAEALPGGGVA